MPVHARGPQVARDTAGQIRGSSLLLVGRLISIGINLLTQILIVRHLSTTEFGAFALAYSIVGMAQVAVTLGLHRGATRYVSMYDEQGAYPRMLGTILLNVAIILGLGGFLILGVQIVPQLISGSGLVDPVATGILLILIFLAPIDALDDLLLNLFAVFAAPRAIFIRRYVLAPGLRLIVAALLVAGNGSAIQLAIGYVLASVLGVALYGALLVRLLADRGILREFRRSKVEVPAREILGFSIPLLTTDAVWLLLNTFPLVLLTAFGGLQDVAAFQVIKPTAALNLLVSSSFAVLFLPVASRLVARNDEHGVSDLYWRTAIWTAVMTFPIFAVTFALANPLTELLFGERYEGSGIYLAIMSLGYYVHAALGFNATTLSAAGRIRSVVSVNGVAAIASVLIGLALIPPLGALGAAITGCATLLLQNVLLQLELRRTMGIPLIYRPAIEAYLVIGVAAGILLVVETYTRNGWWMIGLVSITSLVVAILTQRALRIDDMFPEVHSLLLGSLRIAGRRLRRTAAGLDLLRSTGPRDAWRRFRVDRRWDALGSSPRRIAYWGIWSRGAAVAGARIRPVGADALELSDGDAVVIVRDHVLQIDTRESLELALDKPTVTALLRDAGLPVPDQLKFGLNELDAAEAFMTAWPGACVVKPANGATGSGVTTGIRTRAQLARAIVRAAGSGSELVIERQADGLVYRLLFLDGELLDVLERRPPQVVGDGRSSIGQLIDAENARRITGAGTAGLSLLKVDLDTVFTLEQAGLSLQSVLENGLVARVKTATNQNGPADNRSIWGHVAPDFVESGRAAARIVGLRLAGIDMITTDPTRSLDETGGVIVDVNGTPGLHYHAEIADPASIRVVAAPIVRSLLASERARLGHMAALEHARQAS